MPSTRRAVLTSILAGSLTATAGCLGLTQVPEPDIVDRVPAFDGAWHQPQFDSRNTAHVPDATGFDEPPGRHWHVDFTSQDVWFATSPAADETGVFLPSGKGLAIHRFGSDGAHEAFADLDWSPRRLLPPVIVDDSIYLAVREQLVGIRRTSGEVVQRIEVPMGMGLPTIAKNTLYAGREEGGELSTFAVDLANGAVKWRVNSHLLRGAPAVAGGRVFVGDMRSRVTAVEADPTTEHPSRFWTLAVPDDWVGGSVVADDDAVYVPTGDKRLKSGHVVAYSHDGDELWRTEFGTAVTTSPALADGTLYVVDADARLHALDAGSGDRTWTFPDGPFSDPNSGGALHDHSPVVAGETVVYTGGDDRLHALSPDGDQLWQTGGDVRAVWSPVIVGDAIVYGGLSSVGVLGGT